MHSLRITFFNSTTMLHLVGVKVALIAQQDDLVCSCVFPQYQLQDPMQHLKSQRLRGTLCNAFTVKVGAVVVMALRDSEVVTAQLEQLMISQGLLDHPAVFRGSSSICMGDNIASLMALVGGDGRNKDLDEMKHGPCVVVHIAAHVLLQMG
jgi:hypothetical protein